jgi:glyoxylase-like metal-dependent hydrolase (beta-lactamase superfamily II)
LELIVVVTERLGMAADNLFASNDQTGLVSLIPGLHATPATPLPFLDGVVVRSFVLERKMGNVIIYHSPGITAAAPDILKLGRPDRLLVNHWHESMYDAPVLQVPTYVHEKDRRQTDLPIAGTFSKRQLVTDDIEVIPTPGHTPGTTMFLWDSGEHRVLFPGDAIWVQDGEWKAVLLEESGREPYLASLSELIEVDFDILIPWGTQEGQAYGYAVSRVQAREKLERIIERLTIGQNG